MGTETDYLLCDVLTPSEKAGKLNNPLMGTETYTHNLQYSTHSDIKVN